MQERRRAKRHSISYYLQVMDFSTQKVIGNLADVSAVGIMIDGPQAIPVGKEIHIRMDTTPEVANIIHIDFFARVKWCQQDSRSPGMYDIGLEFTAISAANSEILARIVEKYGSRENNFKF
jgi:hypothetical protein